MVHVTPMKSMMAFVLLAVLFSVLICQGEADTMKNLEIKLGFNQIPVDYTCDGRDISPKIVISGLNATSVAIIVDDPRPYSRCYLLSGWREAWPSLSRTGPAARPAAGRRCC
jgi:hypothetical protein